MQDNAETSVAQQRRDHQLTIRIPRNVRAALDAQAERERRSVADVVNHIFEKHLATASQRSRRR
jgi:hypothetical protein